MRRLLIRTMLIVNFAKQSPRPFQSAAIRLLIAWTGAIGLGIIVSSAIRHALLPDDLPLRLIMTVALVVGYILGGFVILAISSSQNASIKGTTFQRVIKLLPLGNVTRWILPLSAPLIVLVIIASFGVVVIHSASNVMNFNSVFTVLSWVVGLLCGYGCMILRFPRNVVLKGLLFIGTIFTSLMLFDKVLSVDSEHTMNVFLLIISGMIVWSLVGFVQSYKYGVSLPTSAVHGEDKPLIPNVLPYGAWFVVKLWRNRRTRNSFYMVMVLSVSSAVSIIFRNKTFEDPYGILLFGAILSAMFACDVRGVMRRNIPPEIVLLRGAKGIVRAEMVAVIIGGVIIGLPVYMAVHSMASSPIAFGVFFLALQLFASLAGLFASTLFVPSAGDTGSQFFAAALATSAILGLPKLGHFTDVNYDSQSYYWLSASVVLGVVIFITEIIRRRHYGRA